LRRINGIPDAGIAVAEYLGSEERGRLAALGALTFILAGLRVRYGVEPERPRPCG
jgi:hypothetical protein